MVVREDLGKQRMNAVVFVRSRFGTIVTKR